MKPLFILFFLLLSINLQSQTVYKTPNGERYHLSSCEHIGKLFFAMSIEEAKKIKLTACKVCKPDRYFENILSSLDSTSKRIIEPKEHKANEYLQCKGTTKAGVRCKSKTKNTNGYCYNHKSQS